MSDRMLAEINSYEDLHRALRTRAEELQLSRESIDAISGIPPGYAAKLLAPRPIKKLGGLSMPLVLPALGVKLVLMVDDEKTAAVLARTTTSTRSGRAVRAGTVKFELSERHMKRIRRKGGANSRAYMTKKRASELGRKAILARWNKAA
jgi:hypothetical protein